MPRLLTLGGLSLVDENGPLTGAASQRSRLALLAVLAAAGPAGVSRDKLLALLWPESGDERARHALKQAVYALRRDLGTENAIVGTAALSLDPTAVASDIRDFDEAISRGDDDAAVALYAGPFLDGVFIRAAPEFDQWASAERTRLERAYLDAIGRLARRAESAGDLSTAVVWWRRAAAAEPLSGRVALALMRALAESGDVSAAMQHARVHDAVVQGELESPAEEAVLTFAEQLRNGDWAPTRREPVPPPVSSSLPTRDQGPESPAVVSSTLPSEVTPSGAPLSGPPQASPKRAIPQMRVAVVALVLVAAMAMAFVARDRIARLRAGSSPRRIVVAALDNRTGDSTLDPLGELAADYLASTLIESNFEVFDSRTSALATRRIALSAPGGSAHDRAEALAAQTGAATVVIGSYYRQGDSLQFDANIIDPARGVILHAIGPLRGPRSASSLLVASLANRVAAAMAASTDSTAGGSTAKLADPPSVEAFEHTSRAWEMFFARPMDTSAVFGELSRAMALDSAYNAPLLMRAYILDVKEQWPSLAEVVAKLEPRRSRMGRPEHEALELFESDLRGDLLGRLRASRELVRLSPGSADMSLLLAVSASYLNRAAEAHASLANTSPDRGINTVSPMYWAWRAWTEHALGMYDDELHSAAEELRRFPAAPIADEALVRGHAARGNVAAIDSLLAKRGLGTANPSADAMGLGLHAARELRAHGHASDAKKVFGRIAVRPLRRNASRDEQEQHANAAYESGDFGRARSEYAALLAGAPDNVDLIGRMATTAVLLRDTVTTRQLLDRLSGTEGPYSFGRPNYWLAHVAALSGRSQDAIALLHKAIAQGYRPTDRGTVTLHEDGDFASLWKEPAFQDLIRPRDGPAILP